MELLNRIDQALDSITGITDAAGIYTLSWNGCQTLSYQVNFTAAAATAKTFDSGKSEVTTFTFPSKAGSTGGDYGVVFDSTGLGWAFALNKSGADPAPTGAVWAAIPAGRKTNVDISSATTAAQVAALVETAFDALTSNPFTTDDSAADGTMTFTCVIRGNTTNAERHNANDSGNGSLSLVVTTAGVASEVDITLNTVAVPTHGYATGRKVQLTTTGTLPGGLSLSTDYFLIVVDANTLKFASTLVNAQAGTPIDITNQGTDGAVNTITPVAIAGASVKLQKSNGRDAAGTEMWSDEIAVTGQDLVTANITQTATFAITKVDPTGKNYRLLMAITAGELSVSGRALGKGPMG